MDAAALNQLIAGGETLEVEFKGEEKASLNDLDLVEAVGLIEAKGERRGRVYHFSAKVYRHLGKPEDHTRVHGLDPLRQEATVLQFVTSHGSVRRENVIELCGLDRGQAYRLLKRLVTQGKLAPEGSNKGRKYLPGKNFGT